jgi:hypothetical protein
MSNLTASQIAINVNFSGLRGERATWATITDVKAAYFYAADESTTSLDLARALSRGARVLLAEGRKAESAVVTEEFEKLQGENVFTTADMMDLYIEEHGVKAAAEMF